MSWGDEKDEVVAARDDTQAKTAAAATEAPLREDVPARGKGKNTSSPARSPQRPKVAYGGNGGRFSGRGPV